MTTEEAIRILDPKTYPEAIAEIEYYAGFNGVEVKAAAVTEACNMAVDALRAQATIVHCRDCKHLYFKDFEAFCPHRVGPCKPSGFCECGERSDTCD